MPEENKFDTDLDREIQKMVATDLPAFVQLIGVDCYISAKICILKSKGKSNKQTANRLRISYRTAEYRGGNCDCRV